MNTPKTWKWILVVCALFGTMILAACGPQEGGSAEGCSSGDSFEAEEEGSFQIPTTIEGMPQCCLGLHWPTR